MNRPCYNIDLDIPKNGLFSVFPGSKAQWVRTFPLFTAEEALRWWIAFSAPCFSDFDVGYVEPRFIGPITGCIANPSNVWCFGISILVQWVWSDPWTEMALIKSL